MKINKEFYHTVRRMREAQKEFFRTRERTWLDQSKIMEQKVDKMLEDQKNNLI